VAALEEEAITFKPSLLEPYAWLNLSNKIEESLKSFGFRKSSRALFSNAGLIGRDE